ncbi:MAG: choice-of-anchor tandem repeat GloVer-containing protein [Candidatus Korobacteraceae bacterium]
MQTRGRFPNVVFGPSLRADRAALTIPLLLFIFVFLFLTLTAQPAQAQTFNVLYNFTGGKDGGNPAAGLTMDKAGDLYGTAGSYYGTGYGSVFKLGKTGSGWVLIPLYDFTGGNDGAIPGARVVFGPDGTLYSTAEVGGGSNCVLILRVFGCGLVFSLKPGPTALGPWEETVLYRFTGGSDGALPYLADLAFDQAGNIYGTTWIGGSEGNCLYGYHCGTVFKLTRSGDGWNESVIWNFGQNGDGVMPVSGVIFDQAGNLYGTTSGGGQDGSGDFCYQGMYGPTTVYQLTPSGSGWTENILYTFPSGSGDLVYSGLIFDQSGNLYGAGCNGGLSGSSGGFAFKLMPSDGSWAYSGLYNFSGGPGAGPVSNLFMDSTGSLYGTTFADGAHGYGSVFKLTLSDGTWTQTVLHDFTGGSDGAYLWGTPAFDANGNLYGTAWLGGAYGNGVIWEITP